MTEPTFESAQRELEVIVERLERGDASLDEAIALWQRGRGAVPLLPRQARRRRRRDRGVGQASGSRGAPVRLESRACLRQSNRSSTSPLLRSRPARAPVARVVVQGTDLRCRIDRCRGGIRRRGLFHHRRGRRHRDRRRRQRAGEARPRPVLRRAGADRRGHPDGDDHGRHRAPVLRAHLWEFRPLVEGNSQIAWKLLQALAKQLREARAAS